jgi:anti-anti-sigma factor
MGPGPFSPARQRSGEGILRLASQLSMDWRRVGGATVVSARGDIDLSTLATAETALEEARGGANLLILDLREVGFMDTSGLRLVIEEQQRAVHGGYRFGVVPGLGRVQRLFEIAGLANDEELFMDAPTQPGDGDGG